MAITRHTLRPLLIVGLYIDISMPINEYLAVKPGAKKIILAITLCSVF